MRAIVWVWGLWWLSGLGQAYELDLQPEDRIFLGSLALSNVPEPQQTAGNPYVDDDGVARLGQQLFFDTRLSANGEVSCGSCHVPEHYFTDGLPQSKALGTTRRNAPSVLTALWSPWQFWDGRKDSMWSQALSPLEDLNEHGLDRQAVATVVSSFYGRAYAKSFKPLTPEDLQDKGQIDEIFVNVGRALMAYQYRLRLQPSRFDRFVTAVAANEDSKARELFTEEEFAGLKLFVGAANCISCHNGPLLSNFEFHNVGVPELDTKAVDLGRYVGAKALAQDEFNCLSELSGAAASECLEITYLKTEGPELVGAFKTPSLRNVAMTAPYMHSGQFPSLEAVVDHYDKPKPPFYDPEQHPNRPHFDILPLGLSIEQKSHLVAFLKTLTSPLPKQDPWWNLRIFKSQLSRNSTTD